LNLIVKFVIFVIRCSESAWNNLCTTWQVCIWIYCVLEKARNRWNVDCGVSLSSQKGWKFLSSCITAVWKH